MSFVSTAATKEAPASAIHQRLPLLPSSQKNMTPVRKHISGTVGTPHLAFISVACIVPRSKTVNIAPFVEKDRFMTTYVMSRTSHKLTSGQSLAVSTLTPRLAKTPH